MRIGACIGVALIVVALVGCTPEEPRVSPPASPSAEPLFASDEEALAAAEEAYAAYLAMSDEISHDGGANPERIAPFVTEERFPSEIAAFEAFSSKSLHTSGATGFDTIAFQRADVVGGGAEVAFYACWNGGAVRILDESGSDVTPDRIDRVALEIVVRASTASVVLESAEPWSGESSC